MALQNIKIRGLGAKGVMSDLSSFDTGIDSWSSAHNVRFSNGKAEKMNGYIPVFYNNRENALVYEDKKQIPMHLALMPQSNDEWVYFTTNAIWYTNGWNHTSMVPELIDTGEVDEEGEPIMRKVEINVPMEAPWSTTEISNSLIANSIQLERPLGLVQGTTKFKELEGWDPSWKCSIMRSFKNFAMAVGGGDEFPQRVRWSNIVPPNALPADWGWETDANGNVDPDKFIDGSAGGYNDLSFAKGGMVDGRPLRDQFIIYTTEEVVSCDYVGGNDIFRFKLLYDDGGAINPDCVAEFENKHFVVAANDIYIHNGGTKESVIDGKVREELLSKVTDVTSGAIKVVPYLTENEIWVIYSGTNAIDPNQGPELPNKPRIKEATQAAVYNYKYGTWSFVDIPRTLDIKVGPIPVYDEQNRKVNTWEALPDNYLWEDSYELWNLAGGGSSYNFKKESLLCASSDGGFYVLDRGTYFTTLGAKNPETKIYELVRQEIYSELTKSYIDLDELTDTTNYKTVLSIWPQVIGAGELYIQVGGSEVPGGQIILGDSVKFTCGKDRKVDLRENHRYLSLRIQNRSFGDWQLTGFDAVVRVGGIR